MGDKFVTPGSWLYTGIVLAGILIGSYFWSRRWKSHPEAFPIFIGAICGAFFGAKIMFLFAEGWFYWTELDRWIRWVSGKSIIGALLGGYAGVEITKWWIGHRGATGDWFAVGVPLSIAVGRVGCWHNQCCLGMPVPGESAFSLPGSDGIGRWPAVPLELGFNLLFVSAILPIVRRGAGQGQLFHLYLITYGLFRFWHEGFRETPKWIGELSGYQLGALALVALGAVRGWQRHWISQAGKDDPPDKCASGAE
ncbi:MAG: prolipoprotein diacylglyceryl transferase family protein [Verrucomicrobiota bacterium]